MFISTGSNHSCYARQSMLKWTAQEENMAKVEELIQEIQQLSPIEKEQVAESVFKSLQSETGVRKMKDLQACYPGEWLAVIIPAGEDRYAPQLGRLVAHSPERSFVWRQVAQLPATENVYVFFTGPAAAKGFGVIFHDTKDTPVVATVGN
jgi:hypothetical protein